MPKTDWKQRFADRIGTAQDAMRFIKPGNSIFVGTGCAQPQHLVEALVKHSDNVYDAHIIHLLTMGSAPYADEKFREKFKMNSFFVADNVRHALDRGVGDYTPVFLSEIPEEFESGRIPVDVALICVSPPDAGGLCSFGVPARRDRQGRHRQRQVRHRPGQQPHAPDHGRQLHPRRPHRHAGPVRRADRHAARAPAR